MSHHFKIGDWVIRHCPGTIGHESIGEILDVHGPIFWVRVVVGLSRMEGWKRDAWSKDWCIPYFNNETPDWEV